MTLRKRAKRVPSGELENKKKASEQQTAKQSPQDSTGAKMATLLPSSMTLRKRNTKSPIEPHKQKNVKPSEEVDQEESSSVAAVCLKTDQLASASFLRYEIVEKKGQRILVPVRYSIRN